MDPEFLSDIEAFLPTRPLTSERVLLSEEEVTTIVQSMLERIYTFTMARSRENQLQFELSAIRHHNEEGRLLRALYEVLPSGSRLHDRVRRAIVDLRWELAAERYHQEEVTGSGVEVL